MNAYSLPSRWVLFVGALLTFLVLGAGIALACTVYFGTSTIENLTTGSGEYTVVGDPSATMDRCDGAGSGTVFSALNDNGSDDDGDGTTDGDVIRVEIGPYNDSEHCDVVGRGDGDGDGAPDHSLAPSESGVSDDDVYVNVQDGYSYYDDDDDDIYEDSDGSSDDGNEIAHEESSERDYDCMGDGSGLFGDEINHAGPINVADYGTGEGGQFDSSDSEVTANGSADQDGDGVNDVDIAIDPNVNDDADSGNGYAAAVCVSQADGSESAPQIPLVVDSP